MGQVLNIFQYQSVVYNSTTTGALPLTLLWSFPGGSPSAGTGTSETVIYGVPGIYSATLTATDPYGTTDSLTEVNIINVGPSTLVPGISGPTPSSVKMNEGYNVQDASIGNPYPIASWYWQLPYGVTASTQNVGVTGYIDWYTLTGTYSGSPGSYYSGNISLTVDNGFNTGISTSSIQVQKLGPLEFLGLNATGAIGPFSTAVGLTGGILVYPPSTGGVPATLQNLGYPGTGSTAFAFHVDLNSRSGPPNTTRNQYFHSTNELAIVNMGTGFYTDGYLSTPGGEILGGFLIVNDYVYTNYSSLPVSNGISIGEYIIESESYDFYLADFSGGSPGVLSEVYYNRNYSVDLINYLITNPYKLVFSGNLQYVNANNSPGMTFVDLTPAGGSGSSNPVVYSPSYLQSSGSPGPNPVYEVYISWSPPAGPSIGVTASIGSPGSTGNDPLTNGNFYVAQTNSNGPGFITFLNNAINSSIPGGTGTIVFEEQQFFNCDYVSPSTLDYNSSNYHGIALKILDKTLTQSVSISDNSSSLTTISFIVAPFCADISNSQGSTETCSGIFNISPLSPMVIFPTQNNFLSFGGSIAY